VAPLVVSTACDPCAGIIGCNAPPHIAASGRIVDEATGAPAANIPIDFVRTGGVAVERDSLRTSTDGQGQFEFSVGARDSGVVIGFIRVAPANRAAFRVVDLEFPTRARRGEALVFRPWTTVPSFPDFVDVYVRGAPTLPAASVPVEFRRTGGVAVQGLPAETFSVVTDPRGKMPLFGLQAIPVDVGDVIGDLTVFMPAPIGTLVRKDLRVPANILYHPGIPERPVGVGPSLEYHIEVNRRGRPEHLEGVQVQFAQTGGIEVNPPNWTSSTDENGRVAFPVRPKTLGTLIGDITIIPRPPWKPFVRKGLSFAAFESDEARLYAVIEAGPGVGGFAVVRAKGAPIKNVHVDFQRTGGVGLAPSLLLAVSNDSGYAYLTSAAEAEGDVTGDLTIRPPPPYATFVVRGMRLRAFDGDAPLPPLIFGTWDVSSPPASIQQARP
jgi:5-hydroxyisourate hydrolase-like protein (transthyretin family)